MHVSEFGPLYTSMPCSCIIKARSTKLVFLSLISSCQYKNTRMRFAHKKQTVQLMFSRTTIVLDSNVVRIIFIFPFISKICWCFLQLKTAIVKPLKNKTNICSVLLCSVKGYWFQKYYIFLYTVCLSSITPGAVLCKTMGVRPLKYFCQILLH